MTKGSNMNRRSFLKQTAIVGGVVGAAPMILPHNAFGANDRIVVGSIGVGKMGSGQLKKLHKRSGVVIGAVADVYLPRAQQRAEMVNADAYQDYRKLLERDDIDGVVIATPLHWHALNCIHAAQAGKDIYCQKPMTHNVFEGRKVVEAVRKYDCVFQTGSQQRSGRNEHIGITHVRNGALGKISRVIASDYRSPQETRHPKEKIPEGLDWDMWCGPAIMPPYNFVVWDNSSKPSWSGVRRFSGGDMTDWGSHGLDIAQWGLGMDDSGPEEVWVEGEPFKPMYSTPQNPGNRRDGPNKPTVYMKYPGDIIMEFTGGSKSGVRFIGEAGSIQVTRGSYKADPGELIEGPLENPDERIHRGYEYAVGTDHEQDWLNCIKERRDPIASVEAGHRTAIICHLGNIARWVSHVTGETGKKLKWDAKEERFTNCPIANSFYLNPPRRKGYELPDSV
ncbi:MAG: Gfo/Idh/MocA family oxidoreductase [Pirellulaceae bacterium]